MTTRREQLEALRAEAVRSRGFIRGAETQLSKVIELCDKALADDTPAPSPEPPTEPIDPTKYADAQAIARWATVPFQTFDDEIVVEVVAFHINGIERVEFIINDGEPVEAERDGGWFRLTLDASDYDGRVEVGATVYPTVGLPRVLAGDIDGGSHGEHSMVLWAGDYPTPHAYVSPGAQNGDGSRDRPFGTIRQALQAMRDSDNRVDGATVYLLPGDHAFGEAGQRNATAEHRWVTLQPAEGVAREDVRIVEAGDNAGLFIKLVRLRDLTIHPRDHRAPLMSASSQNAHLWLDGCVLIGHDRVEPGMFRNGWNRAYATNLEVRQARHGLLSYALIRDCHIEGITENGFNNPGLVVNSSLNDLHRPNRNWGGNAPHPDAMNIGERQNVIAYNVTMTHVSSGQGVTVTDSRDVALVNVNVDNRTDVVQTNMFVFQLLAEVENVYVKRGQYVGRVGIRTDHHTRQFRAHNVVLEGVRFEGGSLPSPLPEGVEVRE